MNIKRFIAALLTAACAFLSPIPSPFGGVPVSAAENKGLSWLVKYEADYTAVTLTPSASGNILRYTTDGSSPTAKSAKYDAQLRFKSAKQLKVVEYDKNGKAVSNTVTINVKRGCLPVSFSIRRDKKMNYYVTLSCKTQGATIYYTTNGSTPKAGSSKTKKYTGEFSVAAGKTVKAISVKKDYASSKTASQVIGKNEKVTKASDDEDISGNYDPIVGKVLSGVNKQRKDKSLYELRLNEKLCTAAQKRAEEIAKDYTIQHSRPNGDKWYTVFDEVSYKYSFAAENLGYCGGSNYDDDKAVNRIITDWMNSPVHRDNILNESSVHIGIGVAKSGKNYYFVQLFGSEK